MIIMIIIMLIMMVTIIIIIIIIIIIRPHAFISFGNIYNILRYYVVWIKSPPR